MPGSKFHTKVGVVGSGSAQIGSKWEQHAKIGHGRDYEDVMRLKGVCHGAAESGDHVLDAPAGALAG